LVRAKEAGFAAAAADLRGGVGHAESTGSQGMGEGGVAQKSRAEAGHVSGAGARCGTMTRRGALVADKQGRWIGEGSTAEDDGWGHAAPWIHG
jgi:hypothetical protein